MASKILTSLHFHRPEPLGYHKGNVYNEPPAKGLQHDPMQDLEANHGKIIICGKTQDGRKFRPSDWAERLTGAVANHGPGRRIILHPGVKVIVRDGIKCVSIDPQLQNNSPQIFLFLMSFATDNRLMVENDTQVRNSTESSGTP